uniref:Uncharacterized protein n=1 Tax=Lepeophtheirus salmonis TaxID=72036 RepID=A0A0K2TXK5_LEPSM
MVIDRRIFLRFRLSTKNHLSYQQQCTIVVSLIAQVHLIIYNFIQLM